MKADILRKKFLGFFKSRKHKVIASDSLVPHDDPTVLFTPAGMNQFKKQFMGQIHGFTRAVTSQRCLRTDDLDKVGKTTGHHTFFEMLGNFSFGDYFKKLAITWAWEFLTQELQISEEKLWVSVYQDDDESYAIWRDVVKVPENRIVKLGDKDNFWPSEAKVKGPNGPCGPCSEIFFDFGADIGCKESVCDPSCSCGRFVEIWNLVFTQFNRKEGGILEPLPQKNIDTGMGLERLAAVMQGARNNFETDLFQPIITEIEKAAGPRDEGRVTSDEEKQLRYAIADHLRAIVFCIYDGVLPSNEARGYIVRKLIRKSILHLRSLGIMKPFLYKLVPVEAKIMLDPYPELTKRREDIAQVIQAEEKNFILTLNASADLLAEKFSAFKTQADADSAGRLAFQVYDTRGIPLEVTKEWLAQNKIVFSQNAFDKELEAQKNRSKAASTMKGDVFAEGLMHLKLPATKFNGYRVCETSAKILGLIKNGAPIAKAQAGDEVSLILDSTAFYAESGGQVGDAGVIVKGKNEFIVTDTLKQGKLFLHMGKVAKGAFKKSDAVKAAVDCPKRMATARNHTATHLLQAALRKVLGAHVKQQGSLVAADRLRFDFTHFKAVTPQELERIETIVNEMILANEPLVKKEMSLAMAKKTGALAFFAEKYEGMVRVVSIGDFSKEFCGGTHLDATGQISLFKIVQEGSVASGVRRIEAVTGERAIAVARDESRVLKMSAGLLNTAKENVSEEIGKRLERIKQLEKQLVSQKTEAALINVDDLTQHAEPIGGINFIARVIDGADMNVLRATVDALKKKSQNCLIALGSGAHGRASLVVGVTADALERGIDASKIIAGAAASIGGSGGGRKDFAQAGGSKPENLAQAFEVLRQALKGLNP